MISSAMLFCCLSASACGPMSYIEPQDHWIFYTGYYVNGEWQDKLDLKFREENVNFWHNYVGRRVPRQTVEEALYNVILLDDKTPNRFFRYLIDHKDTVALQYWQSLKATDPVYAKELQWRQSAWWYPTVSEHFGDRDDELEAHRMLDLSITKVRALDESLLRDCPNREIRHRYVLQLLRKYFYTSDYQKCVDIWNRYSGQVPASALRTQCLNYYGGALLRLKRKTEAAIVYAGIGYYNVYLHYDPTILREIYRQQPNSQVFEFVIQQFVNQYFDNPKQEKASAFNALADEVVRDGKSRNPALWRSAQAALAYIDHDHAEALRLLKESESLKGTAPVKENIRMLRLLVNSTRTDNDSLYEATLYPDLKWLTDHINADLRKADSETNSNTYWSWYWYGLYGEEAWYSNLPLHRVKVLRRVIFLGTVPHFERVGEGYKSLAYLNLYNEVFCTDKERRAISRQEKNPERFKYFYNQDYSTEIFDYLNNTKVENMIQYAEFLRSGGTTPMEKYLIRNSYRDLNYFYDLIGTKYMREEKFVLALEYLQKVSVSFQKKQNISEYIDSTRNPFAEYWITKKEKKGDYGLSFDPVAEYAKAPGKVRFCQLMLRLRKQSLAAGTAKERANAAYAYAVGLYQSSLGYAWALSKYYSSDCDLADYWLADLPDYWRSSSYSDNSFSQRRTNAWLDKAMKYGKDNDFTIKCKILHSKYRDKMRETVKINCGDYSYKSRVFNTEVRRSFCDLAIDYEVVGATDN